MRKQGPFTKKDLALMNKILSELDMIGRDLDRVCDLNLPGFDDLCARRELAKKRIEKLKEIFFATEI